MLAGGDEGFLANGSWNPAMRESCPGRGEAAPIPARELREHGGFGAKHGEWREGWGVSIAVCLQGEGARAP